MSVARAQAAGYGDLRAPDSPAWMRPTTLTPATSAPVPPRPDQKVNGERDPSPTGSSPLARKCSPPCTPVRLAAIDAGDRIIAAFDQTIAADDDGRVRMKLPLDGLPPGSYRLRVLASDGEALAQQEVGIVVRGNAG